MTKTTKQLRSEASFIVRTAEFGFLRRDSEIDILTLAGRPYSTIKVLVRCGAERFTCRVRDLRERMAEVEEKGDYVRDVAILPDVLERFRD